MKRLLGLLGLMLKAAFFFTLFAFALNNQHEVVVHFFFGHQWTTSLVVLVLLTLTIGVALGVLAMVPRWWRKHQLAQSNQAAAASPKANPTPSSSPSSGGGTKDPAPPHTVVPPPDSIYGP